METYGRMLRTRWPHYQKLNLTRDPAVVDGFWDELSVDWLNKLGHHLSDEAFAQMTTRARARLYSADSDVFQPFEDAIPILEELHAKGMRMAVLSNWDQSLHRVLAAHGLTHFFEFVFASLEWGPEKPDPALFRIVESQLGVAPQEILHVGDDPLDDLQGAATAGWRGLLVDRGLGSSDPPRIASLKEVAHLL